MAECINQVSKILNSGSDIFDYQTQSGVRTIKWSMTGICEQALRIGGVGVSIVGFFP
jgi:hypothetical protein